MTWSDWILVFAGLCFFALPGILLVRLLGLPLPWLSAFAASAVSWFSLVLFYDSLGWVLSRASLLGGWAAILSILAALYWRSPTPKGLMPQLACPRGADRLWALAAIIGLISVFARAVTDPLSGWDNGFRWDGLARTLLTEKSLHFYPPLSAADYELYGWCDGIPPLTSLLNFWLYLAAGSSHAELTAARIVAESLLLCCCVAELAGVLWGVHGKWPALGLIGTSALLLWSLAIGQETGLQLVAWLGVVTTVCLDPGMPPNRRNAIAGALLAALGALSREYGLALVLIGAAGFLLRKASRSTVATFVFTAVALSAPWYIRNYWITGNPFYSLNLIGLFPVNAAYATTMESIAHYWSWTGTHLPFSIMLQMLALVGGFPALLGLASLMRRRDQTIAFVLSTIAVVILLWAWSVPQTAGGWHYSVRVLAPAIALSTAMAGWVGAHAGTRSRWALSLLAVLLATDAARRAWHLPSTPFVQPLPYDLASWREMRDTIGAYKEQPLWSQLIARSNGRVIGVDSPAFHEEIRMRGGRAAPLFSPALSPLLSSTQTMTAALNGLRDMQVRLIMVSIGDPISNRLIVRHPVLRALVENYRPLVASPNLAIFDLDELEPIKIP